MTVTRPEGIKVGDVVHDGYGFSWLFTGFNHVVGEPFALDHVGWPVLASELISREEWHLRKPAHPSTPFQLHDRSKLSPIGTARSWPIAPHAPHPTWEIVKLDPELRGAWGVHTGWYDPGTGLQRRITQRRTVAVVLMHVGMLPDLACWYDGDHESVCTSKDQAGRWR